MTRAPGLPSLLPGLLRSLLRALLLIAALAGPAVADAGGGDPDRFWGELAQPGYVRYRQHLEEGQRLASQDPPRWVPAIAAFQRAVRLLPGRPEAHLELGRAYQRSGECAGAVRHLERALAAGLEPGDERGALLTLGDCQRKAGEFREALATYGRALGRVLAARRHAQAALERLTRAEVARGWRPPGRPLQASPALDAAELELRRRVGDALVSLGRLDEAEASYREALGIDERHAFSWLGLGVALALKERFLEAEEAFKRALQAESSEARLRAGQGVLEGDPLAPLLGTLLPMASGRLEEAIKQLRPLLEGRQAGRHRPQLLALLADLEARQQAVSGDRKGAKGPSRRPPPGPKKSR